MSYHHEIVFHCSLYICVYVCVLYGSVCASVIEQNSSQTDAQICTCFLLTALASPAPEDPRWHRDFGCLGLYWNCWPWDKGQGHSDVISIFTPPRNRGGVIFSLQFVCVSVSVSGSACEQDSSRTDEPIWTQFSLNGFLPHLLGPYWNWWPCVKVTVT